MSLSFLVPSLWKSENSRVFLVLNNIKYRETRELVTSLRFTVFDSRFLIFFQIMGTAMVALKKTIATDVFDSILSFLDDSSHVVVCGQAADDIGNIADLDGLAVGVSTRQRNIILQWTDLYNDSMSRWHDLTI